jgi:hypothetical protein
MVVGSFKRSLRTGRAVKVDSPVPVIYAYVGSDHKQVKDIEKDYNIHIVENLVNNSARIADQDDEQEENALPLSGSRPPRFYDGRGPCHTEANQHARFKKTHPCFYLAQSLWGVRPYIPPFLLQSFRRYLAVVSA